MTEPLPGRPGPGRPKGTTVYPQHIIDQALLAMAYTRQARAAHEQMKLAGIKPLPTAGTLREWRHKYSGRLAELTEQYGADIDRHIVSGYMDIVSLTQDATKNAVVKANEAIEAAEDSRMITALSGAARNMATVYGISQEKILLVQGKPTTIFGKEKDVAESLRSLADKFGVDSTATDERKELES